MIIIPVHSDAGTPSVAEFREFLLQKGLLGTMPDGSRFLGSDRLRLTEEELNFLVETTLRMRGRFLAQFLIKSYVTSDWAIERARPDTIFLSEEMKVYALISRDLATRLVTLASSSGELFKCGRVHLAQARRYLEVH